MWLSRRHEGVLGVREGGEQEWRRQGEGGLGETREAAKLARQCGQSFAANPATVSGTLNGDRHWPSRPLSASLQACYLLESRPVSS